MTGHVLYRLYDANRVLLYVGSTAGLPGRLGQHAADKPWWPQVASIVVGHYGHRDEVREAEQAAIDAERPVHNQYRVIGKTPRRTVRIADGTWQAAQALATARGEILSDVIRRALEKYVAG